MSIIHSISSPLTPNYSNTDCHFENIHTYTDGLFITGCEVNLPVAAWIGCELRQSLWIILYYGHRDSDGVGWMDGYGGLRIIPGCLEEMEVSSVCDCQEIIHVASYSRPVGLVAARSARILSFRRDGARLRVL
jgi:hypothetical protein